MTLELNSRDFKEKLSGGAPKFPNKPTGEAGKLSNVETEILLQDIMFFLGPAWVEKESISVGFPSRPDHVHANLTLLELPTGAGSCQTEEGPVGFCS